MGMNKIVDNNFGLIRKIFSYIIFIDFKKLVIQKFILIYYKEIYTLISFRKYFIKTINSLLFHWAVTFFFLAMRNDKELQILFLN